ncbi:hypothetical protein ACP4OV_003330 [Aristida adscensionis]
MTNGHESMICLSLVSLALLPLLFAQASSMEQRSSSLEKSYIPVRRVVYRTVSPAAAPAAAAPHQPFKVCSGCHCCEASNSSNCVDTRCCFAISCRLPGKPFGQCAFVPVTCGCSDPNNCPNPPASATSLAHLIV